MKKAEMTSHKVAKARDRVDRYSMYDFIDAVHLRPQLWERQHADYHSREKREQAWQEVARRLHPKFDSLSAAEKQKTVTMLTKRWKNTRDSYFRAQRRTLSLKDQDEGRSYIYEKEMRFLMRGNDDLAKLGGAHGPDSDDDDNNNNDDKKDIATRGQNTNKKREREEKFKIKAEESVTANTRTRKKRRGAAKAATTKAKTRRIKFAEEGLPAASDDAKEVLPQDFDQSPAACATPALSPDLAAFKEQLQLSDSSTRLPEVPGAAESDPDQAFFDSIKPVVRDMSVDQKLDFQIEVLKLLKDFRGKQ